MPDTGLPPGGPCQAPSFLWSPPALKQATRAFRLAGDRIAIGARGSLGASSNRRAGERSARSGKQGPRQCLEVWSCLPLRRMAESSAGDFTAGKIQKTRRQRVAKMYGQQKRNIIHTSSTAYEQDHSAAAHNRRARRPGRRNFISSLRERKRRRRPSAGDAPSPGVRTASFARVRFTNCTFLRALAGRRP